MSTGSGVNVCVFVSVCVGPIIYPRGFATAATRQKVLPARGKLCCCYWYLCFAFANNNYVCCQACTVWLVTVCWCACIQNMLHLSRVIGNIFQNLQASVCFFFRLCHGQWTTVCFAYYMRRALFINACGS